MAYKNVDTLNSFLIFIFDQFWWGEFFYYVTKLITLGVSFFNGKKCKVLFNIKLEIYYVFET